MIARKPPYRFIYLAGFLMSMHLALTLYINSSFLGKFFDVGTINTLYIAGSILTVFGLMLSGRFLKRFGNWPIALAGIAVEITALLILGLSNNIALISFAFIVHHALPTLMFLGLDIFFEGIVVNGDTEKVRSYYLTFLNSAFVIAPLIVGALAVGESFSAVYLLAAACLGVLWLLIFDSFKNVKPQRYRDIEIMKSLARYTHRKGLSTIFFLNFFLQAFYAVMVIFMAPYLHTSIGLSWPQIGLIYTVMLLPFVIFDAPLGRLFNKYHDERDILMVGFAVIAGATISMAFLESRSMIAWMIVLFISRIGASFIEVACEAYFYKRITDQEASLISIYRLGMPLAYIFTPFAAGLIFPAFSFAVLLGLLGTGLLVGVAGAYRLS